MEDAHLLQSLGRRVRAARTARGLSLRALGEIAGVSERFLVQLEGGSGNISVVRLHAVARALDTSASRLLADEPATSASSRRVIALLGLRGAGKSTVGQRVAEALGVAFVELDDRVETAAGMRLGEMFELHGSGYYHGVERETLDRVLGESRPLVLATGGGLVTDGATYARLRAGAHTVWLRARAEDHLARVVAQGDARPMANRTDAMSDLRRLLEARTPLYEKADHVVDTSRLGLERSVQAVVKYAKRVGLGETSAR